MIKISINSQPIKKAFGGGNQFLNNLVCYLKEKNCSISFDLEDSELDVILIIDPRKKNTLTKYSVKEIYNYLKNKNSNVLVIHRINECDERKDTKIMNIKLKLTNKIADHTIFIASWLKNLNLWNKDKESSIILNGSDKNIFYDRENLKDKNKYNIVTHHWSNNYKKGFRIYKKLDELLNERRWSKKINFTYIGNTNPKVKFENAKIIEPLYGHDLAQELNKHHIYLTASENEPCGNHQIEGGMCGLPILYLDSGALPETCKGFGVEFNHVNFEEKLNELINNYEKIKKEMPKFNLTSDKMCNKYYEVIQNVLRNKSLVLSKRNFSFYEKLVFNFFPF